MLLHSERDEIVDYQIGKGRGAEMCGLLRCMAAQLIPLLQRCLSFFELSDKSMRLSVIASVGEAAQTLVQVTDQALQWMKQCAELKWRQALLRNRHGCSIIHKSAKQCGKGRVNLFLEFSVVVSHDQV